MLASTVQFSSYDRVTHLFVPGRLPTPKGVDGSSDQAARRPTRTPPPAGDARARLDPEVNNHDGCSLRTQQRARPTP